MIRLRALMEADTATIHNWPAYPPEFADLDYALRTDGWLAEHRDKPNAWVYVAELDGEIVAFTILAGTGAAEAEFRIALRADKVGHGLGRAITALTLAKGFEELKLVRMHLIVRKNNSRAIRLYQRIGFVECGECMKIVNGKQVNFLEMKIGVNSAEAAAVDVFRRAFSSQNISRQFELDN